ncbi:hypothetical protein F01_170075 [Burkholderia cenocepacia]|nr:hypothetical protein F01_170075 [Burkholderia cenocepacia]
MSRISTAGAWLSPYTHTISAQLIFALRLRNSRVSCVSADTSDIAKNRCTGTKIEYIPYQLMPSSRYCTGIATKNAMKSVVWSLAVVGVSVMNSRSVRYDSSANTRYVTLLPRPIATAMIAIIAHHARMRWFRLTMVALVPPLRAPRIAPITVATTSTPVTPATSSQKRVRMVDVRKRKKGAPRSAGGPLRRRERDDRVAHAGEERRLVFLSAERFVRAEMHLADQRHGPDRALRHDALQVLEIDGRERHVRELGREMEQPALERLRQYVGAARAFREDDDRVTLPQRVAHRIERVAPGFAMTVDQHDVQQLLRDVALQVAAVPVIARGDRPHDRTHVARQRGEDRERVDVARMVREVDLLRRGRRRLMPDRIRAGDEPHDGQQEIALPDVEDVHRRAASCLHARPAAHARRAEPRNAGAAGCAPDGSCLNFFKFVAACRRSAIIGRFAVARCCVAANAPVGGVIIGCCTSARLQFESISLRSGQRIIASFAKKRQIGAARPAGRMLDASGRLGDDEGRSSQAGQGRFAARGIAAGNASDRAARIKRIRNDEPLRTQTQIPESSAPVREFARRTRRHGQPGHAVRGRRLDRRRRARRARRVRPRAVPADSAVAVRADGAQCDRRDARARARAEEHARRVPERAGRHRVRCRAGAAVPRHSRVRSGGRLAVRADGGDRRMRGADRPARRRDAPLRRPVRQERPGAGTRRVRAVDRLRFAGRQRRRVAVAAADRAVVRDGGAARPGRHRRSGRLTAADAKAGPAPEGGAAHIRITTRERSHERTHGP